MDALVPLPPDKQELILYRLDQQDKESARNRMEVKEALAVVATESAANRAEVKQSLTRVFEVVSKTNGRVTALERFKWMVSGALVVIVTVMGWYVGLHGK
jgi:hypothetical protein